MRGAGLMGLNLTMLLWVVVLFGMGAHIGMGTATNESLAYDTVRENITSTNEELMAEIENDTENQVGEVLASTVAQQYVVLAQFVTTSGFEWGYNNPEITRASFRIAPVAIIGVGAFYGRKLLGRRRP